ncbi:hypothetical protein, partial [Streptomyces europaeiscabiei]|uniref:hypothetical protein n=1 Tax=Streptomyces europaeiscabiei TaxID=146819 RepID=UPI0038F61BF4
LLEAFAWHALGREIRSAAENADQLIVMHERRRLRQPDADAERLRMVSKAKPTYTAPTDDHMHEGHVEAALDFLVAIERYP